MENYYRLPINEFVLRCHEEIPALYGKAMVKKITEDSRNKMSIISDYMERGDVTILHKKYYEIKTSFLNKSGNFGIKNIRPWQNFDYFILCFIDTTNGNDYRSYFYCVKKNDILNHPILTFTGQNNTKTSNENNTRVGISTTFDNNMRSWLFKKLNVLEGDTYDDLMNYIIKTYEEKHVENNFKIVDKPKFERNPAQKIYLSLGNLIIDGCTNKEVMINLVKYLGPEKLDGIMWKSWLNKTQNNDRTEYVGNGYYFNPKYSIRDLSLTINQINKKLGYSFKIIKK